ncbi:hypothetical protein [Streptomyces sp. NPDC047014]|uniref:pPIWI_RE_Z domain-containing protein n=1 Tax=Streptomyces sp. NPDC047014 TaxID=3155736 RepID=UPI0033E6F17F
MRNPQETTDGLVTELARSLLPDRDRSRAELLCAVETGLLLQEHLDPRAPAVAAWALFSGYPFARARGLAPDGSKERMRQRARHVLWPYQERPAWAQALAVYRKMPQKLRGYVVSTPDSPALRNSGTPVAAYRWTVYEQLLGTNPPFARRTRRQAGSGLHVFAAGRSTLTVDLPVRERREPAGHDLGRGRRFSGPLRFERERLLTTAARMDRLHDQDWVGRLSRILFSVRRGKRYRRADQFTVDGLQHLVGLEGEDRRTLRDVLTVHTVLAGGRADGRGGRVTVVVGDEPEALRLVDLYNLYTDGAAAPVLEPSGIPWHVERLLRTPPERDSLSAYLDTSCALDLPESSAGEHTSVDFGGAPCSTLQAGSVHRPGAEEFTCPSWSACGRHHAARSLVDADIWVVTPSGLVDGSPPVAQNSEDVRFLELACRRSDLLIVDDADRVQDHLDRFFAPAQTLFVQGSRSFLEDVQARKARALAEHGHTQLFDARVEAWSNSLDSACRLAERICTMLAGRRALREAVGVDFFSARTLRDRLVRERFPLPEGSEEDPYEERRARLAGALDAFRLNPFGDRPGPDDGGSDLTAVLMLLLSTAHPVRTRHRLAALTEALFDDAQDEASAALPGRATRPGAEDRTVSRAERVEFLLLLSALEDRLPLLTDLWPQARSALRAGFNSMYRSPVDYAPLIPEPPMGEALGFRFERSGGGRGKLSFLHCQGVGRELLRAMPRLPEADGLPGGNVLLMSGTSWAGLSHRYHVSVPVGVVVERAPGGPGGSASPHTMRGEPALLSPRTGPSPATEAAGDQYGALRRMAVVLGASEAGGAEHGGPLQQELKHLPDGRDHLLLLVNSYDEAALVANTLHSLSSRWYRKVLRLVRDDGTVTEPRADDYEHARTLRRADLTTFRDQKADVLVAPLRALSGRHGILNHAGTAVFGTVYFLSLPTPHPGDLNLAVSAANDRMVRALHDGSFDRWMRDGASLEEPALRIRRAAARAWNHAMTRDTDPRAEAWDMIVLMWQAVSLLTEGDVPARVVIADPGTGGRSPSARTTAMLSALAPYFDATPEPPTPDHHVAQALYGPLRNMLHHYATHLTSPAPDH